MIASFTGKRESYKDLFESRFKIEPNVDNPSFDMPVRGAGRERAL